MAGRPLNIQSPEDLLSIWEEYKQSVDENPDIQQVATGKGVMKIEVKKPYQRAGFEAFVFKNYGFHVHQYIDNYEDAYVQFLGVVTYMRREWESDQIEGTLTGRYKAPNLVARLNGLTEKTELSATLTSKTIDLSKLSDQALKEILNAQSPDSSTGAGGTVQA